MGDAPLAIRRFVRMARFLATVALTKCTPFRSDLDDFDELRHRARDVRKRFVPKISKARKRESGDAA
jgi:hypothetical protein